VIRNDIIRQFELAEAGGYALGSFSPRNTFLIPYVIAAAQEQKSPVIVQISSNEMKWFELGPREFAEAFFAAAESAKIPVILHLDHTYDMDVVKSAIEAGFQSVMIDGSKLPFLENITLTRQVAEYAHAFDVAVEAELGSIGGADKLETGGDESFYTVPEQAAEFVLATGCDSLAVSVGTAHGVYAVKNPKLDFDRIQRIRSLTPVPLVLHGGSGLPQHTVEQAIRMGGKGGIIKLNIATDLELIFQKAMGTGRMPNRETVLLDPKRLKEAGRRVQAFCEDRIRTFLFSSGKAADPEVLLRRKSAGVVTMN
jgi:fructose-bisphosphate aldolase class II